MSPFSTVECSDCGRQVPAIYAEGERWIQMRTAYDAPELESNLLCNHCALLWLGNHLHENHGLGGLYSGGLFEANRKD